MHISSDEVFSKILKKSSIVQKSINNMKNTETIEEKEFLEPQ